MHTEDTDLGSLPIANSAEIIGAIVDALRLDDDVLTSRTAKRFFQGRSINEHNEAEIFLALGESLVERGLVPVPPVFEQCDVSTGAIIGVSIARAGARWDRAVSRIQGRSTTTVERTATIDRLLRFVVIDLAVRIFAILRLSSLEPSRPGTPLWAMENGGGRLLRKLAARAGLTRYDLAMRLGTSTPSSVDNWLDGKVRPTNDSVAALSGVLADQIENATPGELTLEIQRQFIFAGLANLIEPWIGRQKVIDLSTALVRLVWLMTEDVRRMNRPPLEEAMGLEFDFVRLGTLDPEAGTLLENLATVEPDESWRQDLLAATLDWGILFEGLVAQVNPTRTSAGLAQEIEDVKSAGNEQTGLAELPAVDDPAREAISQLADEGSEALRYLALGKIPSQSSLMKSGIERRRAIARYFPQSPLAHSELGSFLGMAGKHLGRRDLIDEGITECAIASGLLPGWDLPAVEQGIILANFGAFEEALERLERVKEALPYETAHFRFAKGYVLMELTRYPEALELMERVLEDRPDYAKAALHAAHCAFMLGDNWVGQRHAKRARGLGEPDEFTAWKAGRYSRRKSR
ncbi:MAG: hypothetical protein F4Y49_08790 [Dehalococcoidia bacterium]|nr:hypothetical protein [Dehalococcoidia bacterium]